MLIDAEEIARKVSVRVSHRFESDDRLVEVRRYFCTQPIHQAVQTRNDALVINMALTSRPANTRVDRAEMEHNPLSEDEAGRLLLMLPGAPYNLDLPCGSFHSLYCAIGCAGLEAICGQAIDWRALGPLGGDPRTGLGIEPHLLRIREEVVGNRICRDTIVEASLNMICVELSRRFSRASSSRSDVHAGGLSAWRMRLILGRVQADAPAPRVPELADLCGLSERQLARAFKVETGSTIGRFIGEMTMERAYRMLTTTKAPIAAIADDLGFASAESFAQFYRRQAGVPPSKVRRS